MAARYDVYELEEATRSILPPGRVTDQSPGAVHSVSLRPDGAGLDVSVTAAEPSAAGSHALSTASPVDVAAVRRRLAALTSVDILSVEISQPPAPTSRQNDFSPWQGGAAIRIGSGGYCSDAFAVRRASTGKRYLLTAGHCMPNGGGSSYDGAGDVMGSGASSEILYNRDSLLVGLSSNNNIGRVYDGPYDEQTYYKNIIGANFSYNGDYVCTSGANSGVHCNIKVINDNTTATVNGYTVSPIVIGSQVNGSVSHVGGDSGGPVFAVTSVDANREARGVISIGYNNYTVTCPRTAVDPGYNSNGVKGATRASAGW